MPDGQKQSPIEMIFFDVGDVLLIDFIERKTQDLALKYGIDIERLVQLKNQRRPQADRDLISDGDFWRLILRDCGIEATKEDAQFSHYMQILPGGLELAQDLRHKGYRVGILSNDSREMWAEKSECYAFAQFFDPIVISSHYGAIKPEPEIYQIAIDQAHCPAERCLFIDDRKANIRTAEQAGMAVILMTGIDGVRSELIRLGIDIQPSAL